MRLVVQSRSGREVVPGGVELGSNVRASCSQHPCFSTHTQATVDDLASAIHRAKRTLHPSRQRLTLPPASNEKRGVVLNPGTMLKDYALADGSVVLVKDLGPQVGWTTVFVAEYGGPLLVYPLFYLLPQLLYSSDVLSRAGPLTKCPAQTLALWYYCFHYTKRILETLFVHRYVVDRSMLSSSINTTYTQV